MLLQTSLTVLLMLKNIYLDESIAENFLVENNSSDIFFNLLTLQRNILLVVCCLLSITQIVSLLILFRIRYVSGFQYRRIMFRKSFLDNYKWQRVFHEHFVVQLIMDYFALYFYLAFTEIWWSLVEEEASEKEKLTPLIPSVSTILLLRKKCPLSQNLVRTKANI